MERRPEGEVRRGCWKSPVGEEEEEEKKSEEEEEGISK